jgi:hypothetical protein
LGIAIDLATAACFPQKERKGIAERESVLTRFNAFVAADRAIVQDGLDPQTAPRATKNEIIFVQNQIGFVRHG